MKMSNVVIVIVLLGMMLTVSAGAQTESEFDRFEIRILGGWGYYSNEDINKRYLDDLMIGLGAFDDRVDNGPGYGAELKYYLRPDISVSLGLRYLRSESKVKHGPDWIYDGFNNPVYQVTQRSSLITEMVAPELLIHYHKQRNRFTMFAGGGVFWYFGEASLAFSLDYEGNPGFPDWSVSHKYEADNLGILLNGGVSYALTSRFSVGGEMGFRYCVPKEMKNSDGDYWEIPTTTGTRNMKLDFTGVYFAGYTAFHF
ncbi:outer membrane beta-barrel protein [candidate division KSB1 bacterium]